MNSKPNILFITTDQQCKNTLGCYGNRIIKTPNIDCLAKEGIKYNRAYCQSPICIPSRITMITGKTAQHHGATLHNTSIRNEELTIGSVLSEQGYKTHFIGKPHFKSQQHRNTEESIADWRDGLYENWQGPYEGFQTVDLILGHSNSLVGHYGKWLRENHPDSCKYFINENMTSMDVTCGQGVFKNNIPEELYSSSYVGSQTCKFIEDQSQSKEPFYCFASFPDPHWPIYPPREFYEMYDDVPDEEIKAYIKPYENEPEKDNYPPNFKQCKEKGHAPYDGGGHYMKNPDDAVKITRAYWGSISLIDKNVGKILSTLKKCGLEENTLVIFTTDHGDYMGNHGMMAKGGFVWEEFINTPFIAKYPPLFKKGINTDAFLSYTDIVPTILDLINKQDSMPCCDGLSQLPVMTGEADSVRDYAMVTHFSSTIEPKWPDIHVLIKDEWKLVYFAGSKKGELYNLKDDKSETSNLYNKLEFAEIQQQMIYSLLDYIILEKDKQPHFNKRNADNYGVHPMHYDTWKKEFDNISKTVVDLKL